MREAFFITFITSLLHPVSMVVHSTFPDFALFLYIHMAYADGHYHPAEHDTVLEKLTKLFPGEPDPKAKLAAAIQVYNELDSSELPQIIKDGFKHFSHVTFPQRYKVYTDLYDIINADGKVDESELRAINVLKDIINAGSEHPR